MSQYPEEVSLRQLFRNYKNKDQFILVKVYETFVTMETDGGHFDLRLKTYDF